MFTCIPRRGASEFAVDHRNDCRHLRLDLVELVLPGRDQCLKGGNSRRFAHAAWQLALAAICGDIAEAVGGVDLADDFGVSDVVVVEGLLCLRLLDLEPGEAFVDVQYEVLGEVLAASPLVET
jgi:hypothetical protein